MADKHTPEPWVAREVHPGRSNTPKYQVAPAPGSAGIYAVAEIVRGTRRLGERAANADRIVACVNACEGINPEAVPELLAAAKRALACLEHEYPEGFDAIVDAEYVALRAAIAKAEGRD